MTKPYLAHCGPCNCPGGVVTCDNQCTFTDSFTEIDDRWRDYGNDRTEGGGGYALDDVAQTMTATGSGSLTLEVTPNPVCITVAADLIDNGTQTESGVTIRRADSDSNISLVRIWGTTDAWELRQGDTVLESFTAAGTQVRLFIPEITGSTVSVECYVGGVLAHTETGVPFTLPDRLNLGLISQGGGEWDSATVSPCPVGVCTPGGCRLPLSWHVTVEGVSGDLTRVHHDAEGRIYYCGCDRHPSFPDKPHLPDCDIINGAYRVLNNKYVSFVSAFSSGGVAWDVLGDPFGICDDGASSVFGGPRFEDNAVPSEWSPDGTYPAKAMWVDRSGLSGPDYDFMFVNNCEYTFHQVILDVGGFYGSAPVVTIGLTTSTDIGGNSTHTLVASLYITLGTGSGDGCGLATGARVATYESDNFTFTDGPDLLTDPMMLTLTEQTALCDTVPGSLTVTPADTDDLFSQYLLGCENPCQPLLGDGTTIIEGEFGGVGISFCVELIKSFNENTSSWEWAGETFVDYYDCSGTVDFAIKCLALEEGQKRQWWLIITFGGEDTYLPLEVIDGSVFSATASGTVDVCGLGPFVAHTQIINEGDAPDAKCDERSILERFCDPPCADVGDPEAVIVNGVLETYDGSIEFCAGMGGQCNPATNAQEWFADFGVNYEGLQIIIRCEDRDGEGRKWWGHVTINDETDYFPMVLDSPGNLSMDASGSVGGVSFDIHVDDIDEGSLNPGAKMIYEACGSPQELLAAYACINSLCVSNQWSSPPAFCPCPDNDTVLGWDEDLERFVGKHPQCGCPGTWELHVWYSGGQWHWLAGSEEIPVAQGTVAPGDVSCDPFKLEFGWFTTSVNRQYNMTVTGCFDGQ